MNLPQFGRLILIAGLLVCPLGKSAAEPASDSCGLLWQVESKAAAPAYLFGTIHSEDPRVLDLPPQVSEAFERSDTFVMELIPDFAVMTALMQTMYYQDQRNLKDVLGDELFNRTIAALEKHGIGAGMAVKMKPWAAAVTLSFPKPKTGMFLDLMLYNQALRQQKEALGLESAAEQLKFFTSLSTDEQIVLLETTLDQQDEMAGNFDKLVRAWLAREPETLMKLSRDFLKELPNDLAETFKQDVIVDRNQLMAERLEEVLAEGDAFIAVGAMHLYDEEGLVNLLREAGYQVTCVY